MKRPQPPVSALPNTGPVEQTGPRQSAVRQWAIHWVYPRSQITPLGSSQIRIGRGPENDCVLEDASASRHHANIVLRGGEYFIEDAGSSHGIQVNNARVRADVLTDGTVVRLGSTVGVVVHAVSAATPPQIVAQHGLTKQLGSGKLLRVYEQARTLGQTQAPVFIHGETGTGKDALAYEIHWASARSGDFLPVNCATIRGDLASASLFGHVRGAFSGATASAAGLAHAAQRGTLFLDEVAELENDAQALLLRLLQNGELLRVGSTQPERVDVRVVSASHRSLEEWSRAAKFRADLFYRLAAHQISVPALRERKEDIVPLFLLLAERDARGVSAGFVSELLNHTFPGNIRELSNYATRLRSENNTVWGSHEFVRVARARESAPPTTLPERNSSAAPEAPGARSAAQLSREDWQELAQRYAGNAASIARSSGFSESSVKRYLKKFGLRDES